MHSFFFFKQKTSYEMRISDWSSDVCSSDLGLVDEIGGLKQAELAAAKLAGLKPDEYRVEEMSPKRDFAMQLLSRFSSQTRYAWVPSTARNWLQTIATKTDIEPWLSSRTAERRVGTECVSTCSTRWSAEY